MQSTRSFATPMPDSFSRYRRMSVPAETTASSPVLTKMARTPMIQGMKPAGKLLALGSEAEAGLTLDQQAFLQAAREWLKRASLVDVEPSASHEPRPKRLGGSTYPGVLWIVLKPIHQPLRGERPKGPHESVQLGMSWDGFVFGGWQGYPYVWEFEKNEAFRFAVDRFGPVEAEAAAFAWAERELRPPAPS